jgi:superfamily I DNA and/or RNA helicase
MMPSRPYIKNGIAELEEIFSAATNRGTLQALSEELSHRKTSRAKRLKERVAAALVTATTGRPAQERHQKTPSAKMDNSTAEADTPDKSTKRSGTEAKPTLESEPTASGPSQSPIHETPAQEHNKEHGRQDSRTTSSPTHTPRAEGRIQSVDELISRFIESLAIEVEAIRTYSRESVIDLYNGHLIDKASDTFIYRFPYDEDAYFRDDAPILLTIGEQETNGTIVSFAEKEITIAVEQDFGETITFARIKTDDSFLVERLKQRYEEIAKGEAANSINKDFLDKLLGLTTAKVEVSEIGDALIDDLDPEKQAAVRLGLGSEVTFIWGPPGTGKTYVLARLIQALYQAEKKILVVSNTNLAVDTLLEMLCDRLLKSNDRLFGEGSVVRYGNIAKEELRERYEDYVNVEAIVARLSEKLIEEKDALEANLAKLNLGAESNERILGAFTEMDASFVKLEDKTAVLRNLNEQLHTASTELDSLKGVENRLREELLQAENAGTIKRLLKGLDPERIQRMLDSLPDRQKTLSDTFSNIERQQDQANHEKKTLISSIQELRHITEGKERTAIEKEREQIKEKISPIETRLAEINLSLSKMREHVINNCRVLAATATQTYLKPKDFRSFDAVIIDEASMLIFPMAAYAAALARQHVIIAGDFRQLPPIVQSDDEQVKMWVGTDIFQVVGIPEAVASHQLPPNLVKLNTQYRMDNAICALINDNFYDGTLKTDARAGSKRNVQEYPEMLQDKLIIVDTSSQSPFVNVKPRSFSRYNVFHAVTIRNLLHWLSNQGFIRSREDVGVISPYKQQSRFIKKLLQDIELDEVSVGTVHRFQGNEKDVIVFDIADSYGLSKPSQFIRATDLTEAGAKLINVAVSRARSRLLVIANLPYLLEKLPEEAFLKRILSQMQRDGKVIGVAEIIKLLPKEYQYREKVNQPVELDFDPTKMRIFDQNTFDSAILTDMHAAQESIVIYSAFATPQRVAKWSDIFRAKLATGIRIRIVTRPPSQQGSIEPDMVREALYPLVSMGVTVDLRQNMHEKHVFIDDRVWWTGSLNPLSHTGKTDESMVRIASEAVCRELAELESFVAKTKNRYNTVDLLVTGENPGCGGCNALTVFHPIGRYGPYFDCEKRCGWSVSLDKYQRSQYRNTQEPDVEPTEEKVCSECGKQMAIRRGKFGRFWGCTGYPTCKHTEKLGHPN